MDASSFDISVYNDLCKGTGVVTATFHRGSGQALDISSKFSSVEKLIAYCINEDTYDCCPYEGQIVSVGTSVFVLKKITSSSYTYKWTSSSGEQTMVYTYTKSGREHFAPVDISSSGDFIPSNSDGDNGDHTLTVGDLVAEKNTETGSLGTITAEGKLSIGDTEGKKTTINEGNISTDGNVILGGDVTATGGATFESGKTSETTINENGITTKGGISVSGTASIGTTGAMTTISGGNVSTSGNVSASGSISGTSITASGTITGYEIDATGKVVVGSSDSIVTISEGSISGKVEGEEYSISCVDGAAKLTIGSIETNKLIANTLESKKTTFIGGRQITSVGGGAVIESVEEDHEDGYVCHLKLTNADGTTSNNLFVVGDFAICQTFDLAENEMRSYWRKVIAVTTSTVTLSAANPDGINVGKTLNDDAPMEGDTICQLGYANDDDEQRQSAIVVSAVAGTEVPNIKPPYIALYRGIKNPAWISPYTILSYNKNEIRGSLYSEAEGVSSTEIGSQLSVIKANVSNITNDNILNTDELRTLEKEWKRIYEEHTNTIDICSTVGINGDEDNIYADEYNQYVTAYSSLYTSLVSPTSNNGLYLVETDHFREDTFTDKREINLNNITNAATPVPFTFTIDETTYTGADAFNKMFGQYYSAYEALNQDINSAQKSFSDSANRVAASAQSDASTAKSTATTAKTTAETTATSFNVVSKLFSDSTITKESDLTITSSFATLLTSALGTDGSLYKSGFMTNSGWASLYASVNDVTAASITAKINATTGSGIVSIDASHIELNGYVSGKYYNDKDKQQSVLTWSISEDGVATFSKANIGNWQIDSGSITAQTTVGTGDNAVTHNVQLNSLGTIWAGEDGSTDDEGYWALRYDGSGMLANGKISWSKDDDDVWGLSVEGSVTADDGSIGGWTIGEKTITKNNVTLGSDGEIYCSYIDSEGTTIYPWLMRNDGSGQLAGGAMTWYKSSGAWALDVTGKITATSGNIGGWTINEDTISNSNVTLCSDGSISNVSSSTTHWKLGNDGYGQLADGKIKWDANGTKIAGVTINSTTIETGSTTQGTTESITRGVRLVSNDRYGGTLQSYITTTTTSTGATTTTTPWALRGDGSGSLASENISWTSDGALTVKGNVYGSAFYMYDTDTEAYVKIGSVSTNSSGNLTINNLTANNGTFSGKLTAGSSALNTNGSGSVANGNIHWDTNGVLYMPFKEISTPNSGTTYSLVSTLASDIIITGSDIQSIMLPYLTSDSADGMTFVLANMSTHQISIQRSSSASGSSNYFNKSDRNTFKSLGDHCGTYNLQIGEAVRITFCTINNMYIII